MSCKCNLAGIGVDSTFFSVQFVILCDLAPCVL